MDNYFTSGKWHYNEKTGDVFADNNFHVANVSWFDTPFSAEYFQSIANGKLIAHAPDMYWLLHRLVICGFYLEDCIEAKKLLEEIIQDNSSQELA